MQKDMLPNFIIAGATKAGTTSVWEHLNAHPEVCMAAIKEPCFFSQTGTESTFQNGIDWYKSLFDSCERKKARGEASTAYMVREESAQLIHQAIPDVELIFILRDPIERVYSQYWDHKVLKGLKSESFETQYQVRTALIEEYICNSQYHIHLKRFQQIFPKNQIHIFLTNDLKSNSIEFMKNLYDVIQVNKDFISPKIHEPYNLSRTTSIPGLQRFIWKIGWKIQNMKLNPSVLRFLIKVRGIVYSKTTATFTYPPIPSHIRAELILEFENTICFVEDYLDRLIPAWRKV